MYYVRTRAGANDVGAERIGRGKGLQHDLYDAGLGWRVGINAVALGAGEGNCRDGKVVGEPQGGRCRGAEVAVGLEGGGG